MRSARVLCYFTRVNKAYAQTSTLKDDRTERSRHLLDTPWFYRLGFAAGRIVPKAVLYRVADVVGGVSRRTSPEKDLAVRENLRRVFPDASPRELARLSRRTFRNFIRYLVDYGRFRSMSSEAILSEIPVFEGEQNLSAALASGKGIIVVTGHIGNWELGGCFLAQQRGALNVVTVSGARRDVDTVRASYRRDHQVRTIFMDASPFAAIDIMAALRRGEVVAMLIDRWGPESGIRTGFFGGSCYLPKGPLALSRATGAVVLSSFVVRDGRAYKAIIDEPFVVTGEDDGPYARRLADALERAILRYPDQWYNFAPLA